MSKAYFTVEIQCVGIDNQIPGYYAIWYNNGQGTSCTIAENIGDEANAEKMKNALCIDEQEKI